MVHRNSGHNSTPWCSKTNTEEDTFDDELSNEQEGHVNSVITIHILSYYVSDVFRSSTRI